MVVTSVMSVRSFGYHIGDMIGYNITVMSDMLAWVILYAWQTRGQRQDNIETALGEYPVF